MRFHIWYCAQYFLARNYIYWGLYEEGNHYSHFLRNLQNSPFFLRPFFNGTLDKQLMIKINYLLTICFYKIVIYMAFLQKFCYLIIYYLLKSIYFFTSPIVGSIFIRIPRTIYYQPKKLSLTFAVFALVLLFGVFLFFFLILWFGRMFFHISPGNSASIFLKPNFIPICDYDSHQSKSTVQRNLLKHHSKRQSYWHLCKDSWFKYFGEILPPLFLDFAPDHCVFLSIGSIETTVYRIFP